MEQSEDMKYLEAQFQMSLMEARQSQTRADSYAARIHFGVYKTRTVHKGGYNGPLMDEAELLQNEVATMERHLQLAQDHIEHAKGIMASFPGAPK